MVIVDLKGKWSELRAAIKVRWGHAVSDAELDATGADREQLCDLLHRKCGLDRSDAAKEIDQIVARMHTRAGF